MSEGADELAMWTLYDRPTDFPDMYVARLFVIGPGGRPRATGRIVISDDIEGIRDGFRMAGLTRLPRQDDDDPKIVEVWL
jgi:hypothetical protein